MIKELLHRIWPKVKFVHWIGKKHIDPPFQLRFSGLITDSYYEQFNKIAVMDFCFGSNKLYFALHFDHKNAN